MCILNSVEKRNWNERRKKKCLEIFFCVKVIFFWGFNIFVWKCSFEAKKHIFIIENGIFKLKKLNESVFCGNNLEKNLMNWLRCVNNLFNESFLFNNPYIFRPNIRNGMRSKNEEKRLFVFDFINMKMWIRLELRSDWMCKSQLLLIFLFFFSYFILFMWIVFRCFSLRICWLIFVTLIDNLKHLLKDIYCVFDCVVCSENGMNEFQWNINSI